MLLAACVLAACVLTVLAAGLGQVETNAMPVANSHCTLPTYMSVQMEQLFLVIGAVVDSLPYGL